MACIWGGNFSYPYIENYINPSPVVNNEDNNKEQPPVNKVPEQEKPTTPNNNVPDNNGTVPNENPPANSSQTPSAQETPKQNYPAGVIPVSSINNSMIGSEIYIIGSARYASEGKGGDIVYFNFTDMYGNGSIKLVVFDGLAKGKTKARILNSSNVVKVRGEVAQYNGVVDIIVRYVYEQ